MNRLDRASIIPVEYRRNGLTRRHFQGERFFPLRLAGSPVQLARQYAIHSPGSALKTSPLCSFCSMAYLAYRSTQEAYL